MQDLAWSGQRAHIHDMHQELNFMTLDQRREYHLSVECFKQVTNVGSSLHGFFQSQDTRRTHAGENKVKVPDLRTTTGRKGFSTQSQIS